MRRDRTTAEKALRKKIGAVLEARRRTKKVEPAELADASGVDLSQLGKVLRGRAGVSLYSLARICAELDLDPLDVLAAALPRSWRVAQSIQGSN